MRHICQEDAVSLGYKQRPPPPLQRTQPRLIAEHSASLVVVLLYQQAKGCREKARIASSSFSSSSEERVLFLLILRSTLLLFLWIILILLLSFSIHVPYAVHVIHVYAYAQGPALVYAYILDELCLELFYATVQDWHALWLLLLLVALIYPFWLPKQPFIKEEPQATNMNLLQIDKFHEFW